jgi:hypothetical protein
MRGSFRALCCFSPALRALFWASGSELRADTGFVGLRSAMGAAPLTPPASVADSLCDDPTLPRRFGSSVRLRGFLGIFLNTTPLMVARFHG